MTHEEFKDRLFELLNETDQMPIADIDTDDVNNTFKVILQDGTQFLITTQPYGRMFIIQ